MTTVAARPAARAGEIEETDRAAAVARAVLGRLEAAWNSADGEAFGAVYAEDASFVTVRGDHLTGRAAIAAGHAGIFATIYAGSVNRMDLVRAEEIGDGVVLAVSVHTLDCPSGPLVGVHRAMSTSVLSRTPRGGRSWHVVASHNTLVAV
jgi:uncharacterized protein (TIGR02246 family)